MKLKKRKLHILTIFIIIVFFYNSLLSPTGDIIHADNFPSNIILFIGDGMGLEHIRFGSLVEYGIVNASSMFDFPYNTTISTTNIADATTDSAASATAIGTGVKTKNGRIATNWNAKIELTTILEIAKQNGYATGLVATCHLTHATPAAFVAHEASRNNYLKIAKDYSQANVDVLLGGGYKSKYLGSYITDFIDQGYTYITEKNELESLNETPVLGLFSEGDLPRVQSLTEESQEPTVSIMTLKAIELLNATTKPFFLMVEGSKIDSAGHDNDPVYLAHQIIEFEKAIRIAKTFAEQNPDWQLIVTADHETGGLSIVDYSFQTEIPLETDTLAQKQEKRTSRAQEIEVNWSTGGHTKTKVILAGMGPYTEDILEAQHHIDTFSIMRKVIDGQTEPIGEGFYDRYPPIPFYTWIIIGVTVAIIPLTTILIRRRKLRKVSN